MIRQGEEGVKQLLAMGWGMLPRWPIMTNYQLINDEINPNIVMTKIGILGIGRYFAILVWSFGFRFSILAAIKNPYPQIHHDRQN